MFYKPCSLVYSGGGCSVQLHEASIVRDRCACLLSEICIELVGIVYAALSD